MRFGDPAEDADTWFRPLTLKSHVRKGRLHHAAFKGKTAVVPPKDPNNPWKSEVSGRLLSLAGNIEDIRKDAENRVMRLCKEKQQKGLDTSQFQFMGIIHAKVRTIRDFCFMQANVIYTPTNQDFAHGDLVCYDKEPDEIIETDFARTLKEKFVYLSSEEIGKLNK